MRVTLLVVNLDIGQFYIEKLINRFQLPLDFHVIFELNGHPLPNQCFEKRIENL